MRKYCPFLCLLLLVSMPYFARAQYKLVLKGQWDNDSLEHKGTQTFNSLWGYTAQDGREYAIMGSLDSIYFFEILADGKPVLRDAEAGRYKLCVHREFKTYKNYCYAVADEGRSSLQIFDMQYLPDSVHKVYDSDTLSTKAHNLYIDNDRLYLASNKIMGVNGNGVPVSEFYTMTVASLQNPEIPQKLGDLEPPQTQSGFAFSEVHDLYVRDDTAYCSNGDGGLFIYNYKDAAKPKLMTSIEPPYKDNGYNHSNWISEDGRWMSFTDENHGKRIKLYDISELKSKTFPALYQEALFGEAWEQGSVPHNTFIKDSKLYVSYYHEGVVVYDILDPANPVKIGHYDTYPQNDTISDATKRYTGFEGCWNVYPFFASEYIIASDMTNGLFVLKLEDNSSLAGEAGPVLEASLLQNPVDNDEIRIKIHLPQAATGRVGLYDISGRLLWSSATRFAAGEQLYSALTGLSLSSGMYFVRLTAGNAQTTLKLMRR